MMMVIIDDDHGGGGGYIKKVIVALKFGPLFSSIDIIIFGKEKKNKI